MIDASGGIGLEDLDELRPHLPLLLWRVRPAGMMQDLTPVSYGQSDQIVMIFIWDALDVQEQGWL
jgi:hypothetical protein